MKHLTTSQEHVTTTSHQCVSTTSRTGLKWNTKQSLSGTSPRGLSGTYLWRPFSTSRLRLMYVPNETPNKVAVVRLDHFSELHCRDALLVGLYYVFKLLCHDLHLVDFHVSFKYQTKQQNFLASTSRETRRVVRFIN